MKWKDETLQMEYDDGGIHFFNPALIVDIMITDEKYQVTTANREFYTFPIDKNQHQVKNFLGIEP
jgi:hypothetical protein